VVIVLLSVIHGANQVPFSLSSATPLEIAKENLKTFHTKISSKEQLNDLETLDIEGLEFPSICRNFNFV
jgi:hypothetical protein